MKRLLICATVLAFGACNSPSQPTDYQQFAAGNIDTLSFPEIVLEVERRSDDVIPTHFCSLFGPGGCWICYSTGGYARDHNGDGIREDELRDHPQEGYSVPSGPPVPNGGPPLFLGPIGGFRRGGGEQ